MNTNLSIDEIEAQIACGLFKTTSLRATIRDDGTTLSGTFYLVAHYSYEHVKKKLIEHLDRCVAIDVEIMSNFHVPYKTLRDGLLDNKLQITYERV
jgi:hypothetical protein